MKKYILITLMIFTLSFMMSFCGGEADGTQPTTDPVTETGYDFSSAPLNSKDDTQKYLSELNKVQIRDASGNITPEAESAWSRVIDRGKYLYDEENKTSDQQEELTEIQSFFGKYNRELREENKKTLFKIKDIPKENEIRAKYGKEPLSN